MADIGKMLQHCFLDIHFHKSSSQPSGQFAGVGVSPVCGTEAGHSHCGDMFSSHSQKIKSPGSDQESQCGIQASGNSQHRSLAAGMLQTLLQAHSLDHQDLITALFSFSPAVRHKGTGIDKPLQFCLLYRKGKLYCKISFSLFLMPGGNPSPFF